MSTRREFTIRTLIVVGVVTLMIVILFLAYTLAQTVLIIFAGILLGVFLGSLTSLIAHHSTIPWGGALTIVVIALLALVAGTVYFIGPRIADQAAHLSDRLPQVVEQLKQDLSRYEFGRRIIQKAPSLSAILPFGSRQLISAPAAFSSAVGIIVNTVIILFIGIYLAATPRFYVRNMLRLVPPERRPRFDQITGTINTVLRRWLVGRFSSMAVVGILTTIGLWIAGIPLAIVLGLIAALLSFVPYLGPIVSFLPAGLIALSEGPAQLIYVGVIYLAVQTAESYLITPLIQKRAVSVPPALLITWQIIMAAIFGAAGVILATPILVVIIVIIQTLYLQDILGDQVQPLGQHSSESSS